MTDFRSEAEKFVTDFLDYVQDEDNLKDTFNKRTQKMERSPGVDALIKQAKAVFPARAEDGKKETDKLSDEQRDEAIAAAPNVVDTREMFSRRVQKNGGVRSLLRSLYRGEEGAGERVKEFFDAEDQVTVFAKE